MLISHLIQNNKLATESTNDNQYQDILKTFVVFKGINTAFGLQLIDD